MTAYFLAEIEVLEPDTYQQYIEKASPIVARYGGRYVLRSDDVTPVSGEWRPGRLVMIAFKSKDDIRACFTSDEYRAVMHLRESSTRSRAVIIEE